MTSCFLSGLFISYVKNCLNVVSDTFYSSNRCIRNVSCKIYKLSRYVHVSLSCSRHLSPLLLIFRANSRPILFVGKPRRALVLRDWLGDVGDISFLRQIVWITQLRPNAVVKLPGAIWILMRFLGKKNSKMSNDSGWGKVSFVENC